jgi:trk system potassium uptake protein TrkA
MMKAVIVGGGKVGYYLFKNFKKSDYDIVLIERDMQLCKEISNELDGEIICGDGSDLEILKECGINRAGVVAVVTGSDELNLIICQIAKKYFNTNKTICRIKNPDNAAIFKALGVDETVCSTEIIYNLIKDSMFK